MLFFRRRRKPLPNKLRRKVLRRDGYACRYCGTRLPSYALQVDHVRPKSKGGKDAPRNLVAACRSCNLAKGARELPGFRTSTKVRRFSKERKASVRRHRIVLRPRRRCQWWLLWLR